MLDRPNDIIFQFLAKRWSSPTISSEVRSWSPNKIRSYDNLLECFLDSINEPCDSYKFHGDTEALGTRASDLFERVVLDRIIAPANKLFLRSEVYHFLKELQIGCWPYSQPEKSAKGETLSIIKCYRQTTGKPPAALHSWSNDDIEEYCGQILRDNPWLRKKFGK